MDHGPPLDLAHFQALWKSATQAIETLNTLDSRFRALDTAVSFLQRELTRLESEMIDAVAELHFRVDHTQSLSDAASANRFNPAQTTDLDLSAMD